MKLKSTMEKSVLYIMIDAGNLATHSWLLIANVGDLADVGDSADAN
jgi:hypothetical protein